MTKRYMFMSQILEGQRTLFKYNIDNMKGDLEAWLRKQAIITCSIYYYENNVFIYFESEKLFSQFPWLEVNTR